MNTQKLRPCSKCKIPKPFSDFQHHNGRPSGQCRVCRTATEKNRRLKNGIKPKEFSKISGNKKLCMSCKRMKKLKFFSSSTRGIGGVSTYCKPCHAKRYRNKEKSRITTAKYRKTHRARWLSAHRICQFKRRMKMSVTTDGTVNDSVLESLYAKSVCVYCNKTTPKTERTIDHLTPLVRGGVHSANNLAMACFSCNSVKGSQTENEYRNKIKVSG